MNFKPIKLLGAALLAFLFITGQAYALTMGALGDSLTDEYMGNGVSFSETNFTASSNWVQILAENRESHIKFGTEEPNYTVRGEPRNEGYEYNWARSGATALIPGIIDKFSLIEGTEVGSQATGLAPAITAGQVDTVFVGIGSNDYFVRNGLGFFPPESFALDDTGYQDWEDALINEILGAVDTLLGAGDPKILLAMIPPGTAGGEDTQEMLDAINHANSRLVTGAEARNIGIVDLFAWQNDPSRYDAEGNLLIGDLVIDLEAYVGDGGPGQNAEKFGADVYLHPNTAPSALIANEVLAAMNMNEYYETNIPLLTDDEIVAISGYSPVPIPGAIWLLGSGLIGLVGFRRKFKKA